MTSCLFAFDTCKWVDRAKETEHNQDLVDTLLATVYKTNQIAFVQSEVQKHQLETPTDARLVDILVAALVNVNFDFSTLAQLDALKAYYSENLVKVDGNPRMRIVPQEGFVSALLVSADGGQEQSFTTDINLHIALLSQDNPEENLFNRIREFAASYKRMQSHKMQVEKDVKSSLEFNGLVSELINAQDVRTWSMQDKKALASVL